MKNITKPEKTTQELENDVTAKQIKFIDLYCSKYGELSATECAIRAGYSRTSAYQRAHELLNPKSNPATAQIIHDRLMGNMEVWNLNKEKHMANLCRIQEAAKEKGQYGVAAKCEELKGKVQGFYVERNLNLNAEVSAEDSKERIRRMYDREEYEEFSKAEIEQIFGPEPTPEERAATKKAKAKKKKEDEELMREMEKYQEDRKRERDRKYGLNRDNES